MRSLPRCPAAPRRRLGLRRVAVGTLGLGLALALLADPAAATARPAKDPKPVSVRAQVKAMQALATRSADALAKGVTAWETARSGLDVMLQQQQAAERAADVQQLGVDAAQQQLNAVVRAAYVNGMTDDVRAVLSLNPQTLGRSLETVAALDKAGATTRGALVLLTEQRVATARLAGQRDRLRRQAQQTQAILDTQLEALQAQAAADGAALAAAEAKLEQLRAAEFAAKRAAEVRRSMAAGLATVSGGASAGGGPACSAPADGLYVNGFLPDAVLCPLQTAPGHRMVADAAAAFDRMSTARAAATGAPLCVSDSYRDYAGQLAVFASKPSLAATPGRSNHGWGLALDLCGGAESFGTEVFRWLTDNAPAFGFVHPRWAEPGGGRPEPWHWEYSPGGASVDTLGQLTN